MIIFHPLLTHHALMHEQPVTVVIDECLYSRKGLVAVLENAQPAVKIIDFAGAEQFCVWREQHHQPVNMLIIYFHDRIRAVPQKMVDFLIDDIDKLNIAKKSIVIVTDAPDNLMHICARKLNVYNFINGRGTLPLLTLQLKEFIEKGTLVSTVPEGCHFHTVRRYSLYSCELSPAEIFAISAVLTGKAIKESSKSYSRHYKTLYSQKMSAIKKLGMHTDRDLIKYRHLINTLCMRKVNLI